MEEEVQEKNRHFIESRASSCCLVGSLACPSVRTVLVALSDHLAQLIVLKSKLCHKTIFFFLSLSLSLFLSLSSDKDTFFRRAEKDNKYFSKPPSLFFFLLFYLSLSFYDLFRALVLQRSTVVIVRAQPANAIEKDERRNEKKIVSEKGLCSICKL